MAKLIPLGDNGGNENRPSDEELNQMFGAFVSVRILGHYEFGTLKNS